MTTPYWVPWFLTDSILKASIKTGLFSFWLSVISLLQFLVLSSLLHYGKLKQSGKNKDKLRTTHPKNHENLKTASLESNLLVPIKNECM